MKQLVSLNGEILNAAEARLSAVSASGLYGKGVFTTIRVSRSAPFLWEKHWRRLTRDAGRLGIDIAESPEHAVLGALGAIIAETRLADGRARITFFDESPAGLWAYESVGKSSVLITVSDHRGPVSGEFRLGYSPYRINSRSPLAGTKSCNYMPRLLALDEGKNSGFDEVVIMNERGEIASAATANVFWLSDDRLFTPSLKTGCLAGTTRELILENIECREVEANRAVLDQADAIYLTSAGVGVLAVRLIGERVLRPIKHDLDDLIES